jgi:uncharacterized protein (DUF169 family)
MSGRTSSTRWIRSSAGSDTPAQPSLPGTATFSLGCDGSRKFSGFVDEEMVMGFPIEMLTGPGEAIKVVTTAPGSR